MSAKKQQIINKAIQLFAKYGYDQIGMDFIASEAHVSKITIYNHFSSKEQLFKAALIERENRFLAAIRSNISEQSNPCDKIKSIFVFYHNWFNQKDFNGCLFINSTYIFANKDDDFKQLIRKKKDTTKELIESLLDSLTSSTVAAKLASDLIKLLDGTIVSAQVKKEGENPAIDAWDTALLLFKANNIVVKSEMTFDQEEKAALQ